MATPTLSRIDVTDYSVTPPALLCAFFWSDVTGLTCSDPGQLNRLTAQGIATPPEGAMVYPRDGKKFFDALEEHFSGSFLRASPARTVERVAP